MTFLVNEPLKLFIINPNPRFSSTGKISCGLAQKNWNRFRTARPVPTTNSLSRSSPTSRSARWSCGKRTFKIRILHRWVAETSIGYLLVQSRRADLHKLSSEKKLFCLSICDANTLHLFTSETFVQTALWTKMRRSTYSGSLCFLFSQKRWDTRSHSLNREVKKIVFMAWNVEKTRQQKKAEKNFHTNVITKLFTRHAIRRKKARKNVYLIPHITSCARALESEPTRTRRGASRAPPTEPERNRFLLHSYERDNADDLFLSLDDCCLSGSAILSPLLSLSLSSPTSAVSSVFSHSTSVPKFYL